MYISYGGLCHLFLYSGHLIQQILNTSQMDVKEKGGGQEKRVLLQNKIGSNILADSFSDLPTHPTLHFSLSYLKVSLSTQG